MLCRARVPYLSSVLLLLLPLAASAASLRLSMEEAVNRALAASPDLQADRKDVDVATATLQQSRALFPENPYVSLGAQTSFQRNSAAGTSAGGGGAVSTATTQTDVGFGYGLSLSQEVEIAGQRQKRLAVAQSGLERASADAHSAELTMIATVKSAFVGALANAARLTIARQGADAARDLRTRLQAAKPRSGIPLIELNQAEMQESRSLRDVASAERAYQDSLSQLRYLLDVAPDQEIELVGAIGTAVHEPPPADELVERALQQRADLAGYRHRLEVAENQLDLTRREAVPNVTVSGFVSRFDNVTFVGGDLAAYLPVWRRHGGETAEAVADRQQAELRLRDMRRVVEWQVVQARRTLQGAAEALRSIRREILPRSEENLRIERQLYDSRQVAVADLIGIQIDAISARREEIDAAEAYESAEIDLERLVGGSLAAGTSG